jgi:hypothetical protein
LWDAILPSELLVLPDELARVDRLLDDPAFFAPFVPFFDACTSPRDSPSRLWQSNNWLPSSSCTPGATTRRLESGECIPKHLGQ